MFQQCFFRTGWRAQATNWAAGRCSRRNNQASEAAMRALLRCGVTATILLCGFAVAGAQQPDSKGKALASPEQQAEQERAQQSKEGQTGTTEPSSETKTAKPQE